MNCVPMIPDRNPQSGRRSRRQRDVDDDDQHEVHGHHASGHEAGQCGLQSEGGRDCQDDPGRFHSETPSAASRGGRGVITISTSSIAEKSIAGFTVMRLYAVPLFSTASMRPITKPFG